MAARLFRHFARTREPAVVPPPSETSAKPAHRQSEAAGADDAELDTLRGELVRELNRLAERSRGVD